MLIWTIVQDIYPYASDITLYRCHAINLLQRKDKNILAKRALLQTYSTQLKQKRWPLHTTTEAINVPTKLSSKVATFMRYPRNSTRIIDKSLMQLSDGSVNCYLRVILFTIHRQKMNLLCNPPTYLLWIRRQMHQL